MIRQPALVLVFAGTLALGPARASGPPAELAAQRPAYEAARSAIGRGVPGALAAVRADLRAYPLYPYLVHAELARRLGGASAEEVRAFLDRWPQLPLAERLRAAWLRELARREAWETFRAFQDPLPAATDLRCHALAGALARGEEAPLAPENLDLWLHGRSRPEACDPVFAHWRAAGLLTPDHVLERVRLSVLAGQPGLAGWLARQLPARLRPVAEAWLRAARQPERELVHVGDWPEPARHGEFLATLVRQLARRDSQASYRLWPEVRSHLSEALAAATERELAILRATDYGADAVARLAAIPPEHVTQRVLEWRVRVAIARGAWRTVRRQVEAMAPGERSEPRWQYWWARASEALGERRAAEARFAELAEGTHYHGFLAADRVGAPYVLCADTSPAPTAALDEHPGIVRAIELHAVGQTTDARREWWAATRDLGPEARLAAALLAARQAWHHQAILDLAGLGRLDRYEERFPTPWPDAVAAGARRQALPPSLLYAIMRSESALAPDARSGAGARGLMQLLPATAQGLARRAGVRYASRGRLYDPELNILLGSAYLRQLVEELDHPLKVIAAYNAGPRPVERWHASDRLPREPDRWIETIPYYETRDYVPRVLTFQALYEWQLTGRMTRLARMMRPLDEVGAWPSQWGEGPITPACPARRTTVTSAR